MLNLNFKKITRVIQMTEEYHEFRGMKSVLRNQLLTIKDGLRFIRPMATIKQSISTHKLLSKLSDTSVVDYLNYTEECIINELHEDQPDT